MKLLKVALKCVGAGVLIAVGTVLLVLPGPGIPLIVAGVAVLGTEFAWAAALSERMSELAKSLWRRVAPA